MATLELKVQAESTLAGSTVKVGSVRSITITEATEKKFLSSTTYTEVWASTEPLADLDFILVESLDATIAIYVQVETAAATRACFVVPASRPLLIPCTQILNTPDATISVTAVATAAAITSVKVKAASGTPLVRVLLAAG